MSDQFTVNELEGKHVHILSVLRGNLLISYYHSHHLFIYNQSQSTINVSHSDEIYDALWTNNFYIIYTTDGERGRVITMSINGSIISQTQMSLPQVLSLSNDNTVYLADAQEGVFQSIADGFTWKLIFKSVDMRNCWQVIQVTTNSSDFWMLDLKESENYVMEDWPRTTGESSTVNSVSAQRNNNKRTMNEENIKLNKNTASYDDISSSDYPSLLRSRRETSTVDDVKMQVNDHTTMNKENSTLEKSNSSYIKTKNIFPSDYLSRLSVRRENSKVDDITVQINFKLTTMNEENIRLEKSTLSYDGKSNVFLSDYHNKAVYVFSTNFEYQCQIQLSYQIKHKPKKLAVDKEQLLLYVGQENGAVGVFQMIYEEGDWPK